MGWSDLVRRALDDARAAAGGIVDARLAEIEERVAARLERELRGRLAALRWTLIAVAAVALLEFVALAVLLLRRAA